MPRRQYFTMVLFLALAAIGSLPALAGQWREVHPDLSPRGRSGHTMVACGGVPYLFGGINPETQMAMDDFWKWDRESENWVEIPKVEGNWPPARFYHNMVAIDTKILIANGYGIFSVLGDYWLFDTMNETWSEIHISGPAARTIAGMASLGEGRIFVGGGNSEDGREVLDDAWILSFAGAGKSMTISSMQLPPMPNALYGFGAAALFGDPLIFGGEIPLPTKCGGTVTSTVYRFNLAENSWAEVENSGDSPMDRAFGAVVHIPREMKTPDWGDVVIFIGGESSGDTNATSSVQLYDSTNKSWSNLDDHPLALASLAAAGLPPTADDPDGNFEILSFGGYDATITTMNATYIYTTDIYAAMERRAPSGERIRS